MSLILIGSRALQIRTPKGFLGRDPMDFDFIATKEHMIHWLEEHPDHENISLPKDDRWEKYAFNVEGTPIEFEVIQSGKSSELFDCLVREDPDTIETQFGLIPSLDMLFTLKDSHKYMKIRDVSKQRMFWKNAMDWHKMKKIGAKVRPEWQKFLKLRSKETYNYKLPRLKNMDSQNFFDPDQGVDYKYNHDDVHESVALGRRPAYTYYLKDGEQVECDKKKFFALSEETRLNGVIEEACVLAIERALVPHPNGMDPKQAYLTGLFKVCSSITSGWFRAYAFENVFKAVRMYPKDYWDRFQHAIKDGKVRDFDGKRY